MYLNYLLIAAYLFHDVQKKEKLPLVYFVKKIKTNKNRSTQMMNGINLFYSRASFTLFVCLTLYEGRIHAASISQKEFI